MKVNIISDIHATVNEKTGEVLYEIPQRHSNKHVTKAVNALCKKWFDECLNDSNIVVDAKTCGSPFDDCNVAISKEAISNLLKEFKDTLTSGFVDVPNEKLYYFSRGLNNVRLMFLRNNIKWNYKKTKLEIDDIITYMFRDARWFDPSRLEPADYLIIAGDIGYDDYYDQILTDIENKTKGKFKKILHIAGNHDHWVTSIRKLTESSGVNLEHDYCEHVDGDYLFLGCTLWTPISESAQWYVGRHMNDYRYIPKFSPTSSTVQFDIQSTWLKNKIAENPDKKIVVFTHHQPFEELTADDYKHNGKGWDGYDVNAAYVVMDHSLDNINSNGNIVLWACGHTHQNYDGVIHNVHVVRNPIGYRSAYGYSPVENMSETWYNKVIDV